MVLPDSTDSLGFYYRASVVYTVYNIMLLALIENRKKVTLFYFDWTENSQFRLGVHGLEIERGRHRSRRLHIAERLCKLCLLQAVEEEKLLLVDINEVEDSEKFVWLLKQENDNCIHWIGNYIYSAI